MRKHLLRHGTGLGQQYERSAADLHVDLAGLQHQRAQERSLLWRAVLHLRQRPGRGAVDFCYMHRVLTTRPVMSYRMLHGGIPSSDIS